MAQDISAAKAPGMGRKPLGGTGEKTVMKPMRWAPALLARVDEARGDRDRSEWVREAVTEKLEREKDRGESAV
ncbi:hypothetical protein [Sphingomonas sp.]|uniref:hypothetical protein n=1 Tax=Sphingomonas sp. TaxID=28214 RepID=UPI0028A29B7F|nr:hypothetical protein [Sphingomonas sp.]